MHRRLLLAPGGSLDELGNLDFAQTAELESHHVVRATQVGERVRQFRGNVRLGVAKGGEHEQARVGRGPRQVPEEQQRRRVRPVPVLEHEQQRTPPRRRGEEVADDRMKPVTLGVGVGRNGVGQPFDTKGQLREQAGELAARRPEVVPERVDVAPAHELLECLHERPVRRPHHRVARAVENDDPVRGCLPGELADETALARARLAADQRDPAALGRQVRHERPEGRELTSPADEGIRGAEPQRAWELCGCGRHG